MLRRAIDPEHLARYGYGGKTGWIARELKDISEVDPELVADMYAAIFGFEEPSTDTTNMSGSQIFALTSNKKQDYEQANRPVLGILPALFSELPR